MTTRILRDEPLTFPWSGTDPFLLCTHHLEIYPAAGANQNVPPGHLVGRPLGNDFTGRDGYNMYYGTSVPGFPAHPHRGFETVTIALEGMIDHTDSMGSTARYGDGDVQWLTTGSGIMHCEMFPLRNRAAANPLDFYQIWLNLPAARKMTEPAFKIIWSENVPIYGVKTSCGAIAQVRVIAGPYDPQEDRGTPLCPSPPTPDSWAHNPQNDVAIWEITLQAGAAITLPAARDDRTRRTLYFHTGDHLILGGEEKPVGRLIEVRSTDTLPITNTGKRTARIMLLQGVPIGEPVAMHGPFVMNNQDQILSAYADFKQTQFGGWPWSSRGPIHSPEQGRFMRSADQERATFPPTRNFQPGVEEKG